MAQRYPDTRPLFVRLTAKMRAALDARVAEMQASEPGTTSSDIARAALEREFRRKVRREGHGR